MTGNMETAEAEGLATKGCERELRGAKGGGRQGGWTDGRVRAAVGLHCCCRVSAVAIISRQFLNECAV